MPKRLIVMFTHYGCITTRFFPTKSHGPLTASDLATTTLEPLAPFVDKLLIPRGIRGMNEWTSEMVRGQGNDPYLQVVGSYLTCQPVTPNSDNPFSIEQATKFDAKPMGRSPNLTRGNSEGQCTPSTTTSYDGLSQETGTDPALAIAPIDKYYCTLMNALGVKAGEDGFPRKDGREKVARFGRYDRTEDFVHGGTAPPVIHDPGEFAALRANA